MKELTCAFTLTLVSLVAATPHGYGVKGGASAKAEASAVAGSLVGLPLSIPSGTGFSGSFSKSASSSFASSSASSSSSSFSYSGSGSSGLTGFGTKNADGCSSGGCHNGGAGTAGSLNGFQTHGGANAAATAGASALSSSPGSSEDSSLTCTSGRCTNQTSGNVNSKTQVAGVDKIPFSGSDPTAVSETSEDGSKNKCISGNCGLAGQPGFTAADYQPASQFGVPSISFSPETNCASGKCGSTTQPKVPVSNYVPSNDCASGKCAPNIQPGDSSTNNGPSGDCTSGKCRPTSQQDTPSTNYRPTGDCASGKCESTSQQGTPSVNFEPSGDCASGKCGPTSQQGTPSTNYGPSGDCTSGRCGSSLQQGTPSANYQPSGDCASGKCGPTSQQSTPSTNYRPSGDCTSGRCGSDSQSGLPFANYGPNSDCLSGQCRPSSSLKAPYNDYGHPGAASPNTDLNSCKTGQCKSNTLAGPTSPNYEPNDIRAISSGTSTPKSTPDFKDKPSDYDKESTDCSYGNCGQINSPNFKPSYPDSSSTTYHNGNPGIQNQGLSNLGYKPTAFDSGLAPDYNKPASHLTTPKLGSSYNPSNTFISSPVQGTYTPSDEKMCTGGKCDFNPSKGSFSPTDSGAKCTSSNCAPNTNNNENPKNPSYSSAPGYQVPSLGYLTGSPNCASGNCATYPSPQPSLGIASVSAGQYKPSYTHNQAPQQTHLGPTGSAGFPQKPSSNGALPTLQNPTQFGLPSFIAPSENDSTNCKTPNCASYPSTNIKDSAGGNNNIQSGVPSSVDISKPGIPDQKLPVYTGGFGGPAGILKPNEFSSVSIGINKPGHPISQSSYHGPSGLTENPSHHSGLGTLPSATHPGVPSYNTPTGSDSINCKTPNCGSYSSAGSVAAAGASAGATSQSGVLSSDGSFKPNSPDKKVPVYTGGFGGAAGFLKPNDFTQVPASHSYDKPTIPLGTHNPATCTSGKCGSPSLLPHLHGSSSNGAPANALATASANSEADAVTYTGGFGGPPGLLKPYDDGKLRAGDLIKHPANSQFGVSAGGNAVAGAQVSAIAGASSGAVSGSNLHGYGGLSGHVNDHKGPGGCGGGCGSNFAGSYSSGQFGYNGAPKSGHHDGLFSSPSGSGATAKSLAGAVSGANAYGTSGSFASSSATAHASAGAGTKGSYYGK